MNESCHTQVALKSFVWVHEQIHLDIMQASDAVRSKSVLPCIAMCCSVLPCIGVCCRVLQIHVDIMQDLML